MSSGRSAHLLKGAWLLWSCQVVLVAGTGSKLWEVPTASHSSLSNRSTSTSSSSSAHEREPYCQHRHLRDGVRITADIPPRLDGTWVSTRCEVRPGPEFLTRSYTFLPSQRQFRALQHYYADSGCADAPLYSLAIRGKLRLRQASWISRGGTEAEHSLSKVGIVVHDGGHGSLKLASRRLPPCLAQMAPGKLYELYNARAGRACLAAMGFSMVEMGLIRVENHQQHHHHGGGGGGGGLHGGGGGNKVQELFLGDVHTDWTQRTHYRPTGYQQPLQNAMHHIHPCAACALVYRSSEHRAPLLPRAPALAALALRGRWVSQRCEARPAVLFLTRDFTFDPDTHAWLGVYRHYSDPRCSQPTFTLRASGHYAQGNPSARVAGATELVFKVTRVNVTALDEATARVLNATRRGNCGPAAGGWEVGVGQDLTPTDGCTALGIKLPHKEYELFKMELDHTRKNPLLFTGERPTDGSSPDRPQKRPTSFQAPMVLCGGGGGGQASTPSRRYGSGSNGERVQSAGSSGADGLAHQLLLLQVMGSLLYGWLCVY